MGKFLDDVKSVIIKNVLMDIARDIDEKIDSKRPKEPINIPKLREEQKESYRQQYLKRQKEEEEYARKDRNETITACFFAGLVWFCIIKLIIFLCTTPA